MTVHLPTPGTQRRLNEAARFAAIAVRDESNVAPYHVEPKPAEQIRTAITVLDALDVQMLALEARIGRLEYQLADSHLRAQFGPTDPLRIEAEDRLAGLERDWNQLFQDVRNTAWMVARASRQLIDAGEADSLVELGRLLSIGIGALPRIADTAPDYLIYQGWQRLADAAVPF
jgi:hypothetical protein